MSDLGGTGSSDDGMIGPAREDEAADEDIQLLEAPSKQAVALRDRFGFLIGDPDGTGFHRSLSILPAELKARQEKEAERLLKWQKMQRNWSKYYRPVEDSQRKSTCKAKERARKGVPDAVRAWAWYRFCNAAKAKRLFPHLSSLDISKVPPNVIDEIDRDIDRTFPQHQLFEEDGGYGQQALRRLLQRYAVLDPALGYCQGMGFIAAMLLTYYTEQDAFYVFYAILNRRLCPLRLLYLPGLAEVQKVLHVFGRLGGHYLGALWQHLQAENVHPTMYFTEWAMTMFTRGFSFELVTRVWDVLLCEQSTKILYRVALGLIKAFESELKHMRFEQIMAFLRELPQHVDADKLMDVRQ